MNGDRQIERVGETLRAMTPWISAGRMVDKAQLIFTIQCMTRRDKPLARLRRAGHSRVTGSVARGRVLCRSAVYD